MTEARAAVGSVYVFSYSSEGLERLSATPREEVAGKFGLGAQPVRVEWPAVTPSVAILLGPTGRPLDDPRELQSA